MPARNALNNLFRLIVVFVAVLCPLKSGQYDALPLRDPLTTEPHFQTEIGREAHRFAKAPINRYRLYDFYSRQAEFHLAQKEFQTLLLPYPGLEGGRRGHWGGSNEVSSSAVLDRTTEPRYHRLLNRGDRSDQFVISTHSEVQDACVFANSSASVSKVVLDAKFKTPLHPFGFQVDRFGFDIEIGGNDFLINQTPQWRQDTGSSMDVLTFGYHLYGDQVIFRRGFQDTEWLDSPQVLRIADTPVYQRQCQWLTPSKPIQWCLPRYSGAGVIPEPSIKRSEDSIIVDLQYQNRILRYRIRFHPYLNNQNSRSKALKLVRRDEQLWLQVPALEKGDSIQLQSYFLTSDQDAIGAALARSPELLNRLQGGKRYFEAEHEVRGELNADPAASGTAYEFDEIPVPVKNAYGMPMTTTGLGFASDGVAYICTMVGDVWKLSGLQGGLTSVLWQRYATGLNAPLGLVCVGDTPYVLTNRHILSLHDHNSDGEADEIRALNPSPVHAGRLQGLQTDGGGNFYFSSDRGILRVSSDGKEIKLISEGSRNPLGIGVRADGLAISDMSEGNRQNGTCALYESSHPENRDSVAKWKRILYLPRGVDNSPGSRLFIESSKFGPLGRSLIGTSYGSGRIYQILRDPNQGSPQAAMQLLPGEFPSGAARLRVNPADGQLYVLGFDGWGDFAVAEGSLTRVRYTGKKQAFVTGWSAHYNGIRLRFSETLDPKSIHKENALVQQWNYVDSELTYGSPEYSVLMPGQFGHDRLVLESLALSPDGKELTIVLPHIRPAMCTQIYAREIKTITGEKVSINLFATINQLQENQLPGVVGVPDKPRNLEVPSRRDNGATYVNLVNFFDARAGRKVAQRPVGPVVDYQRNDLNYAWIRENVMQAHSCLQCHGKNAKYDFSTYESLRRSLNFESPEKSNLYGMMEAGSMPPFPYPTVDPKMLEAFRVWVGMGAPK